MFPPEWSDRNDSRAEGLIWRALRDETPDDWYAIHSLGLTSHTSKPWAEADFVVVCDAGVIVLEVKGGRVTVERGAWSTNDHVLKESPFKQAGGAAAALHSELRSRFPALQRAIVGWGVALPDVTFDAEGPDILNDVVYDDRDLRTRFERYVDRVADHWKAFHGRTGDRFRPLSRSERAAIVAFLAPSFDLVPTLRARVAHAERELARLTAAQSRVMRGLRAKDRVIVRGGAGTGKTMLALEEAVRLTAEGRTTIVCCRSSLLARRLGGMVDDKVAVEAVHDMMRRLVVESGLDRRLPDAQEADLRDVFIPQVASEAAIELDIAGKFDALVIDEAQDLLTEGNLEFFDTLLKGGLAQGTWRVFLDPRQNVFSAMDLSQFQRLEQDAVSDYDLTENCRNTPEIASATSMLSALSQDEVLAGAGPEVEIRWATDRREVPAVAGLLAETWRRRGIELNDVVILLADDRLTTTISAEFAHRGLRVIPFDEADEDVMRWCAIDDFKGLEATAVIVVGLDELQSTTARRRAYVGLSRARALLGLVLEISAKQDFEMRAAEFARLQLVGDASAHGS